MFLRTLRIDLKTSALRQREGRALGVVDRLGKGGSGVRVGGGGVSSPCHTERGALPRPW